MMNIELVRIIQADREREIQNELRTRQLLKPTEVTDTRTPAADARRPLQRPASTGVASR